ncbi:MAG TPA: hypothetical protein VFZ67_07755, partial [Nitrososphaera sp.]
KKDRTKATAALPMVGAIVTAAFLLSGLSLISSYQQPAIAQQQNMTGGATDGGAATDNATTTMGGAAEGGNATTNATTTGAAGENQSEVRLHLEEARMALQNNDTQGALMHLDLALSALGAAAGTTEGNMTGTTEGATNMTTGGTEGEGGGILEGIFGGGGGG